MSLSMFEYTLVICGTMIDDDMPYIFILANVIYNPANK